MSIGPHELDERPSPDCRKQRCTPSSRCPFDNTVLMKTEEIIAQAVQDSDGNKQAPLPFPDQRSTNGERKNRPQDRSIQHCFEIHIGSLRPTMRRPE